MRRLLLAGTILLLAGCAGGLVVQMRPSAHGPDGPADAQVRANVEATVRALATPRNREHRDAYRRARQWIEEAWAKQGYAVAPESGNLVAELPGDTDEIVVLGAHYDSAHDAPGADDNASGVAAMLEVSRLLAGRRLHRTVRFYAWADEEPPCFQYACMGSLRSAALAKERGDVLTAVLALDSVGYYDDAPGSQAFPAPFGLFFPDRADFVAVVGDVRSGGLVRDVAGRLRAAGSLKVSAAATPAFVTGVDWSDHWSFWQHGWPAVMLTDMPPFRNPHYHEPSDLPDTLDFDRLARFAAGLATTIEGLAADPREM